MTKRNLLIDILKAVLIILVVIGHCIQYGSGKDYLTSCSFFDNKLFIFIYSFHMPAFMIISGYIFGLSKRTNAIDVIKHKISHLLIPIFTWAILTTILFAVKEETITFLTIIKKYIFICIDSLWFLWAVFYSTTASIIIKVYFNNNIYIHLLLIIVSFIIPDILNLNLYKFVYPFFILGYYFHNIKDIIFKYKKTILLISTILFFTLLFMYNRDSYIYTTGHFITGYYQLYIDI